MELLHPALTVFCARRAQRILDDISLDFRRLFAKSRGFHPLNIHMTGATAFTKR